VLGRKTESDSFAFEGATNTSAGPTRDVTVIKVSSGNLAYVTTCMEVILNDSGTEYYNKSYVFFISNNGKELKNKKINVIDY